MQGPSPVGGQHGPTYMSLTRVHETWQADPGSGARGTLEDFVRCQLELSEGCPQFRVWVARAASRLGLS